MKQAKSFGIGDQDSLSLALQLLRQPTKKNAPVGKIHFTLYMHEFLNDQTLETLRTAMLGAAAFGVRITGVTIHSSFRSPCSVSNTELHRFLDSTGKLEHLNHFGVFWLSSELFSISNLTSVISAKKLRSLDCSYVKFAGSSEDYKDFADALKDHPTLNEVDFSNCEIKRYTRTVSAALSTIPNLSSLTLPACFWKQKSSNTEFLELIGRPTIKNLNFPQQICVSDVSATLRNSGCHERLEKLSVGMRMGDEDVGQLCNLLRDNKTLKVLNLHLFPFQHDDILKPLIETLKKDAVLTNLHFDFHEMRGRKAFADEIKNEFLSMLATSNFTLIKLNLSYRLFSTNETIQEQDLLDDYLELNRLGRKKLVQSKAKKAEWVDFLVAAADGDVSLIFSLLSLNPALCDTNDGRGAKHALVEGVNVQGTRKRLRRGEK